MTKDSVPRRKHASRRRPIALGAAIVAVAGAIAVPVVAQAAEDTPRADTALQSNFAAAAAEYEVPEQGEHFMELLGAPVAGRHGVGTVGSAVTIAPGFARNKQTMELCPEDDGSDATEECTTVRQASNFVYVRTEPRADAPLFGEQSIHPGAPGTNRISDWGSTAQAGQQFVVAGKKGDWTAIWFSGSKVWFHNPRGVNTIPARDVTIVRPAAAVPVKVYGTSYPDAAEYPAGLSPSTQAPLSMYGIPAGQAYVSTAAPALTDDFFPSSGKVVFGAKKMYTVQYGHKTALIYADDVTAKGRPSHHGS